MAVSLSQVPGGCWPKREQELLLRAVLLRGKEATDAFAQWETRVDFDRLDTGSVRLLPMLSRVVDRERIDTPLAGKLKKVYRHTLAQNQLRFRDLEAVLPAFSSRGISIVLLKGAALLLEYYRDNGLRPMDDLDLLVPTSEAAKAVSLFSELKWTPKDELSDRRLRTLHAMAFLDPAGRKIDLHWHLMQETCAPGLDDELWKGVRRSKHADLKVLVLHPSDQLVHVCVHGLKWNRIPPVRWVADAHAIVVNASAELDWDRVVRTAERYRFVLPMRDALRYLRATVAADIPAKVLDDLERIATPRIDRWEHRFRLAPAPRPLLGYMPEYWFNWLRASRDLGWWRRVTGFPGYLQDRFESPGIGTLIGKLVQRWSERARRRLGRRTKQTRSSAPLQ